MMKKLKKLLLTAFWITIVVGLEIVWFQVLLHELSPFFIPTPNFLIGIIAIAVQAFVFMTIGVVWLAFVGIEVWWKWIKS